MKYKKGDKVRVKENLETDKMYGRYDFIFDMNELKGKEVIISNVYSDCYRLDGYSYSWTDEMLEEIDSYKWIFNIEQFKNKEIAINCETEDEANKLFDILKDYDLPKGKQNYNEETCYRFYNNGIWQGDCEFYKEREYKVHKFSEIDFSNVCNKESIDKVDFDIIKVKYITREQLSQRGFKTGDVVGDTCNYGIVYGNKVSYITADCQETINSKAYCEIIPVESIENNLDIAKELSKFMYSNLKDYYSIKDYFIPIQEETKQVTICKVNYTANSDKLKEFVLSSNDKVVEGEIVECDANIGNSGWQYARIKEIEIKELTENEFVKYKICRKLS